MASKVFDSFQDQVIRGNINLINDQIYVMLVDATYTPDQANHIYRSSVTGEVTGTGYTAGGQQVAVSVTKDTVNHKVSISLGTVNWANSTLTARGAVYYKHRGGAASADELIAYDDFGSNVSDTASTFSLAASTINLNTPV